MSATTWVPTHGRFEQSVSGLLFKGGKPNPDDANSVSAGIAISNRKFGTGTVRATARFEEVNGNAVAEIVVWYDPITRNMLTAGIGGGGNMCAIRIYNDTNLSGAKWSYLASSGTSENLQKGRDYDIAVEVSGSKMTLIIDGVRAAATNLSIPLSESQVGVFCLGEHDCHISNLRVEGERPLAFVVMEFSESFNELYEEVVRPAVEALGLRVYRADEAYGPGLIVADIAAKIAEARVVIADISPPNANVFFEVGYSFAIGKPPILLALEGTKLPFDVSPFRTLFYANTIKGKKAVEEALKAHVRAVLGVPPHEIAG